MHKTCHTGPKLSRIGALAFAAALTCGAGASHASLATLSIDGFIVSSSTGFVTVADSYQNYSMQALNAGGLGGAAVANRTANNWNQGPNITAQTTYASAGGLLTQFVDQFGLTTAGFSLSASSQRGGIYPFPVPPNYANAQGDHAGAFGLVDANGAAMAGDITFEIYYTFNVSAPTDRPVTDYSQVALALSAFDEDESYSPVAVGLLSTDFASGASGAVQGFFTWTFNLASGDFAGYSLNGTAISSSSVPEPSAMALVALALAGLGLTSRTRPGKAAAAAV